MRALGLELGMLDLEELSAMLASRLVTSPVRYVCAGYTRRRARGLLRRSKNTVTRLKIALFFSFF